MQAELKNIFSPDIDFENYFPEDDTEFSFLLQFTVAPKDKEGDEVFYMEVCSPKWILNNYRSNEMVFGTDKLIVLMYDFYKIFNFIENYVNKCHGNDWEEIREKIGRIAKSEFLD